MDVKYNNSHNFLNHANVNSYVSPADNMSESNTPSAPLSGVPDVAVCIVLSTLSQTTVVPTEISKISGS